MNRSEELTHELFDFYNRFHSWETSIVQDCDCTVSESHAIEVLGMYGKLNMKTLATKLGVTTGTVTVTVDRLETKGYAQREKIAEDRRVYIISLTPKGDKIYKEHYNHHMVLTEAIFGLLDSSSERERRIFYKDFTLNKDKVLNLGIFDSIKIENVGIYPDNLDSAIKWAQELIVNEISSYLTNKNLVEIRDKVVNHIGFNNYELPNFLRDDLLKIIPFGSHKFWFLKAPEDLKLEKVMDK
jgi:DNA-binding MarR family transcriptional regulator